MMQSSSSLASPWHDPAAPEHSLLRVRLPTPQEALQEVQAVHTPHSGPEGPVPAGETEMVRQAKPYTWRARADGKPSDHSTLSTHGLACGEDIYLGELFYGGKLLGKNLGVIN